MHTFPVIVYDTGGLRLGGHRHGLQSVSRLRQGQENTRVWTNFCALQRLWLFRIARRMMP